jgi:hypothetical protein
MEGGCSASLAAARRKSTHPRSRACSAAAAIREAASAIFKGDLSKPGKPPRRALTGGSPAVTAAEIMSSPARTVGRDETVAHALVACQRYGQSGILVADDERLEGVVGVRISIARRATASRTHRSKGS